MSILNLIDTDIIKTKRIDCGAMPNASQKTVPHGLDFSKIIGFHGFAKSTTSMIAINMPGTVLTDGVLTYLTTTSIIITTGRDRSTSNTIVYIDYIE